MDFEIVPGTAHAPYAYRVLSTDFPAEGAMIVELRFSLAAGAYEAVVRRSTGKPPAPGYSGVVEEHVQTVVLCGVRELRRERVTEHAEVAVFAARRGEAKVV